MATDTRNKNERAAASDVPMTRRTSSGVPRRWQGGQYPTGPFSVMRQMQDEVDRWFSRLGFDRGWLAPFSALSRGTGEAGDWMPAVDAFQRGNEFIIRADAPAMTRQDLSVEVGDDTVTIRGERKREEQQEDEGFFWSERSYGSFHRVVPLPAGAISDTARATFANGVLEVIVEAPSQEVRRGRKVDISGRADEKK